ncbi:MAG: hypothetical protein NC344_00025 [Bacteroidales bacterium]|nr:hypothetical protein [Bacteroidales bacterium]MCM1146223.1 hypothetical protein [Bacteroidales bacterium]MCM1205339.1 hypothetical protein [Bacillota bacterium]MCM1509574.1 hypothetical protein [Clostridium sp.]
MNIYIKNRGSFFEKILFICSIFALVFLYSNFAVIIGVSNKRTVAFFPILLYLFYQILIGRFKLNRISQLLKILLVWSISSSVVLPFITGTDAINYLTFSVFPFLIYAYFERIRLWEKKIIRLIILGLLFVEMFMSFYERMTYSILISIVDSEFSYEGFNAAGDTWAFRAQALFGHSLTNAMIVSSIGLFLLADKTIKDKVKYVIYILILLSLFCFNTRGNILVFAIMGMPFLYSAYKTSSKSTKYLSLIMLFFGGYLLLHIEDLGLGGRLFNQDLGAKDSSSMARFDAIEIFQYLDNELFLWGSSSNVYNNLMSLHTGSLFVENGLIVILLHWGIIFGCPLLLLMFVYQIKTLYIYYRRWEMYIIIFAFYIIGMSNPQLANPVQWIVFFLSFYAFRKEKHSNLI